MALSPQVFRTAFNRFQEIHRQECGFALDTFRNPSSYAFIAEDYKEDVQRRARQTLEADSWHRSEIGTGSILQRVIHAIEQKHNNLLQWEPRNGPESSVHIKLLEARSSPEKCKALEALFFALYHDNRTTAAEFDGLAQICGRRYELLGFLFFTANRHRFLPIRTRTFDIALQELGFGFKTERQCDWENYQQFLSAMAQVQMQLRAEGISDATLLDAHSFCWILGGVPRNATALATPAGIVSRIFSGSLREAEPSRPFSPNDDAPAVDMHLSARQCAASGAIAEEIAFRAEQDRLRKHNRPDLAARIESVSGRPGLGFDIQSFETDETPRCIEVKNVSAVNRFFLTANEWQNSRSRSNYWFYLVSGVDENCPVVSFLAASQLQPQHLEPTEFIVRFNP